MPYKYVLKWSKGEKEKITVEAWNRYSTDKPEKPLFTIGQISGSRALLLRERVQAVIDAYKARAYGPTLRVEFPPDDPDAIAEAYRIGLAAAVLTHAPDNQAVQHASRYVLSVTKEEVWFWTSKLLDSGIGPQRTISALCIISGTWEVPKQGKRISLLPPSNQTDLSQLGGGKCI